MSYYNQVYLQYYYKGHGCEGCELILSFQTWIMFLWILFMVKINFGYAQDGFFRKTLQNFMNMQLSGVKLNSATFSSIFLTCATMGALEKHMDI